VWGAVEAAGGRAPTPLAVAVPDDLPPVDVDEAMLRQVLVNLLENAAAYASTPAGSEVQAEQLGDRVEVRVVDHGPGVPEAERALVFEPYVRLPGQERKAPGSGVGLAVSRGFVEAHGGTLELRPTDGGGATFVVALPLDGAES
jgi:two-component system sensor histidine kinase KdpD